MKQKHGHYKQLRRSVLRLFPVSKVMACSSGLIFVTNKELVTRSCSLAPVDNTTAAVVASCLMCRRWYAFTDVLQSWGQRMESKRLTTNDVGRCHFEGFKKPKPSQTDSCGRKICKGLFKMEGHSVHHHIYITPMWICCCWVNIAF